MDGVRLIFENIWAKASKADAVAYKQITSAINALNSFTNGVRSGPNSQYNDTAESFLVQDQNRIIAHFNRPPGVEDDERQQRRFRAEWQPLLRYVLIAVVNGSARCNAYFKHLGRELEHILPMEDLESARFYIRGCSLDLKNLSSCDVRC
ncbi:LOW QUALITY PROTEIN: hypothetical protein IFM46972_06955 [Aspergillus udagawae]|uniref:Uncharacterized protein n=1 Tax=Aspergillus udagawae TaxID=91492 RepID=A0A8H3P1Z3_9EURO|nr:LOW QUALITY PROTEIN: hypothetical protein IFM46972_06955 [Aspergillus udagawae]